MQLKDLSAPDVPASDAGRGGIPPLPGLALVLGGFLGGLILAGILGGVAISISGEKGPALLAASFVGLWVPLVTSAMVASRRFGSGSLRDDLGLSMQSFDVVRGVVVGAFGVLATTATQFALSPFEELLGTNTGFIRDQLDTIGGTVTVLVTTLVGAAVVEEIFFRGLLQRSLARIGAAAVLVQAVVFGMIHADPDQGLGNVGIMVGVGTFGLVQGIAVRHYGRLGPAFWSHAFFNAAAVVPLLVR